MSIQLMQHILTRQVEHFQRQILGICPEKLEVDILRKVMDDKFILLDEENTEVNKAVSLFEPTNINTYFEIIDGYCDVAYVLLAIQWMKKYINMAPAQEHILKSNYNLLANIRRLLPPEIPYAYAFNMVHKANMAKKSGKKPGRIQIAGFDAVKPVDWKEPNWYNFCNTHLIKRKPRKTLILGDARSGKDTYAEYLKYWYGYAFKPAFSVYGSWLREQLAILGLHYKTFKECYEDRVNHRALWYQLLTQYNEKDKSKLARNILNVSDIYPGIRNIHELEAAAELFDRVIYIDAKHRVEQEPTSSNDITLEIATQIFGNKIEVIDNNSSLLSFVLKIWHNEKRYE